MSRRFALDLAGQEWSIEVTDDALTRVHRALLVHIDGKARERGGRYIVLVAGPPGSGKTTLCALWECLSREDPALLAVQTLPLDGFHFPNDYLVRTTVRRAGHEVSLKDLKGCPETYDIEAVRRRMGAVRRGDPVSWPFYDRRLHAPVDNAIEAAAAGILLIEGNYLLLDEPGWRDLRGYADFSIFIESSPETLKDALQRHLKGGKPYQEALQHHLSVDHANYRRIIAHRLPSDITLVVTADRAISIRDARRA